MFRKDGILKRLILHIKEYIQPDEIQLETDADCNAVWQILLQEIHH